VLRPVDEDENQFRIERLDDASFRVSGVRVERSAAMTDWANEAAVRRFQRILEAMGITDALREHGAEEGHTVVIGDAELEWVE
jgi:GTP-binding protein